MLAVPTVANDPYIIRADVLYSQDSSDCFDKEAMKKKYPNISEEAMMFLFKFESAAARNLTSARKKESLVDGCRPSAFVPSSVSLLELPPPKRFTRVFERC